MTAFDLGDIIYVNPSNVSGLTPGNYVIQSITKDGFYKVKRLSESGTLTKELYNMHQSDANPLPRQARRELLIARVSHIDKAIKALEVERQSYKELIPQLEKYQSDQDELLDLGEKIIKSSQSPEERRAALGALFKKLGGKAMLP